jgi:hypothetical protein
VLTDARDALGSRVGEDNADAAVVAADRRSADACKLFAAHPDGGFVVDYERFVVEVGELPASRGGDRLAALVARLDALLVVERRLGLGLSLVLEVVVIHCRPPVGVSTELSASAVPFFRRGTL